MNKKFSYLLMYVAFLIYSFSGVCTKLAGRNELFSFKYLMFLVLSFVVLAIYAILWQQILKTIDLSVAMANRSIILVLALLWGNLIFKEPFSLKMLCGIILIIVGVFIMNNGIKNEK